MTKKKPETLADITTQQVNSNRHTQRGMGLLEKSISERGWIGAITTAANGETFDGSARRETLEIAGLEDAVIVRTNGRQPIIHIREDIPTADDPRAVQLSLEANRIAQLNLSYDPGVLAGLAEDGVDLSGLFFPHELAGILEDAGSEIIDANELWKGMPDFENEAVAWKKLIVHFANEQDYHAFARLVNQTLTPQTLSIWHPYKAKEDLKQYRVEDES